MIQLKNQIYTGSNHRKSVYDLSIPDNFNNKIIVFIHGYKGFKDWGAWHLMEAAFVSKGFGFCKFNMSHNGGTVDQPIDFPDLQAFSENRYSYEVNDAKTIITLVREKYPDASIILMGHSRGGGISLLCGTHPAVHSVITLAGISSIQKRFSDKKMLEQWKADGVRYETNSRTGQEIPLKYIQYEDFIVHQKDLNIEQACEKIEKPCLHFHGTDDSAVSIQESIEIASRTKGPLYVLGNSNHTFETAHPWKEEKMSNALSFIVEKSITFLS